MPKSKQTAKKRVVKEFNNRGFAILNHLGTFWSTKVFEFADEAKDYIARMQESHPYWNLKRHKVVPIIYTITYTP